MAKVKDVCKYVRSKNAGPFWVTFDLFFKDSGSFGTYALSEALNGEVFAELFGTDSHLVKRFALKNLNVLKISYPRPNPQGWMGERDMHQGQSFARILNVELD
jgi:hypothetical protein